MQCLTASEILKEYLVTAPVHDHPNFNLPSLIYMDASEVSRGAVLMIRDGIQNKGKIGLCKWEPEQSMGFSGNRPLWFGPKSNFRLIWPYGCRRSYFLSNVWTGKYNGGPSRPCPLSRAPYETTSLFRPICAMLLKSRPQ